MLNYLLFYVCTVTHQFLRRPKEVLSDYVEEMSRLNKPYLCSVMTLFGLELGSRVRPSDVSLRDLGIPYVRPSAKSSGLGRVWRPSASGMRVSLSTRNVSLMLLTSKLSLGVLLEPVKCLSACPGDLRPQVSL